jgi:hypothetical protein
MIRFNLDNVRITEFGVGVDSDDSQTLFSMTVDAQVQRALIDMVRTTCNAMRESKANPAFYEPSEKYESVEYVTLPVDHHLAQRLRQIHSAANLSVNNSALEDPTNIVCYFARMVDGDGQRLTALRRATHFKGVLKSRLIRVVTDALRLVEEPVFRLDNDFDLLIESQTLHILRPSSFEFIGQLKTAVLAAVPQTIEALKTDLAFVNFESIALYASTHARAARYLASIRSRRDIGKIDRVSLQKMCQKTGVAVKVLDGRIVVDDGHVVGFLEVLDRRRYEVELVKDEPEQYRAASRQQLAQKGAG